MKQIIILLFCLVYVIHCQAKKTTDNLGDFSASEKSCVKNMKLNESMIDRIMKQPHMPEDNADFTNFMACVWRKDGFIDGKDNLVFDAFKKFITSTFAEAIGSTRIAKALAGDSVNSCQAVKGDSVGQRGIKFMNCITKLLQN